MVTDQLRLILNRMKIVRTIGRSGYVVLKFMHRQMRSHRKALMVFAVDVVQRAIDQRMKSAQLVEKRAIPVVVKTILPENVSCAEIATRT